MYAIVLLYSACPVLLKIIENKVDLLIHFTIEKGRNVTEIVEFNKVMKFICKVALKKVKLSDEFCFCRKEAIIKLYHTVQILSGIFRISKFAAYKRQPITSFSANIKCNE